jgi:hypothetical protein
MLKQYPWTRVELHQGFFVPALDLKAVREAGLKAAIQQRVFDGRAVYVIKQGQLGVWFYRGWISPRLQDESSLA